MSFNVFKDDRNKESVAYDLALALAAKDPEITTPEKLLQRIADILPLCRDATEKKYKDEAPKSFGIAFN